MEKLTAWEVFFMLLAVIPVSKMLSSIFMNLVTRVGTVDEDKWAMIGLGAIGATFGLMKKGGMLGGLASGMSETPKYMLYGGSNITTPPPVGGSGITPPNPPVPSVGPGMSSVNANSPGMGQTTGSTGSREQGYPYSTNSQEINNGVNGNAFNPVDMGTNPVSSANTPPAGQRNLNDIINISGRTGDKAAGIGAKFGAASSFAVPGVAPAVAGIYAATGKAVGGFSSTAYNLAGEIKARRENGQGFLQSMRDITGSQSNVAATTQVAMALAMSPIGSRATSMGTQMMGRIMTPNIGGIKKDATTPPPHPNERTTAEANAKAYQQFRK